MYALVLNCELDIHITAIAQLFGLDHLAIRIQPAYMHHAISIGINDDGHLRGIAIYPIVAVFLNVEFEIELRLQVSVVHNLFGREDLSDFGICIPVIPERDLGFIRYCMLFFHVCPGLYGR